MRAWYHRCMSDSSNIFLFTGENTYALMQELVRWKKGFVDKHGAENMLEVSSSEEKLSSLMDHVAAMPFIAEKRLVIVRGIPTLEKEEMTRFLGAIHPQTIVAFVDPKPDKRLTSVKTLQQIAVTKEYKALSPGERALWLTEEAKRHGAELTEPGKKALLDIVGDDQWMLSSELAKLALTRKPIDREAVITYVIPSGERIIWGFTNLLGEGNVHGALTYFREQMERGEDPYGLWVILLDMVKKLVLVWTALQENIAPGNIASELKLSPFVVRGIMPLARSLSSGSIETLLSFMASSDLALKTGGYRYTQDHPEEVTALIERAALLCA